ncbi:hypothetical protein [Ferrimonas balearica]|uniref:hypothetical protein n=1 Tax=Ferrimonas balearica TaxID=44012 RepID=UPI001C99B0FB|nr:hypothetical protein [Ferrimonas balearica]MBY5992577.1 hypothetical protein [Ferrimonas balearica]
MKKTLLCALLLPLTFNVAAQSRLAVEEQKVDEAMSQLVSVAVDDELFAVIEQEGKYERVEYLELVNASLKEIYVSRHQAKEMKLAKVDKYYVYGRKDLDTLIQEIGERVDANQPTYFSVDLYRDYHRDIGLFHYVARITEYR